MQAATFLTGPTSMTTSIFIVSAGVTLVPLRILTPTKSTCPLVVVNIGIRYVYINSKNITTFVWLIEADERE